MSPLSNDETLQSALGHHQAGRLQQAEQMYRQVLTSQPNHHAALHYMGVLLGQLNRQEQAVEHLRRAVLLQPSNPAYQSNLANALVQTGQFDDAIASGQRAVKLNGDYAEAHFNLGTALYRKGRADDAIASFRRALKCKPNFPQALRSLQVALVKQGKLDDAIIVARKLVSQTPNDPEAVFILATALDRKGLLDEAIENYRRTATLKPEHVEAHTNLGSALCRRNRLEEGIANCRRAIALKPDSFDAQANLGMALTALGKTSEAIEVYRRAVALNPLFVEGHFQLCRALDFAGRYDEAIVHGERAIAMDPQHVRAHIDLGVAYLRTKKTDQAIACFHRAVEIAPDSAEAHNNLFAAYDDAGRFEEAVPHAQRAVALKPDDPRAQINLGTFLHRTGEFDNAIARYRRAVELDPSSHEAQYNLGTALLTRGDLSQGWPLYENRLRLEEFAAGHQKFDRPAWDGSPLNGRTILLHAEQGLGDSIQFIRYVARVEQAGGKIVVQCPAPLVRIFQRTFAKHLWLTTAQPLPTFDVHCPLLSLPVIFGISLETVPPPEPLLLADPDAISRWAHRLGDDGGVFRVGLAWAGNKDHKNDKNRSIALAMLAPLGEVAGVRFVSLQKGDRAARPGELPETMPLADWTAEFADFAETAGLIANLDLVIAVDTSVAHLAGTMGKPVWMLTPFVPDWRWLLDRDDSPWYPSMRIFRQPKIGDWASVIPMVTESLRNEAGKQRPPRPSAVRAPVETVQRPQEIVPRAACPPVLPPQQPAIAHVPASEPDLAIDNFQRAAALAPKSAEAHNNLGSALCRGGHFDEGITHYRTALSLQPDFDAARTNLATALLAVGQTDEAMDVHRQAVAAQPNSPVAHFNLGMALLTCGHLPEGWPHYEWHQRLEDVASIHQKFPQPLWDGSPLEGRTILLYAEQGFGDSIQFIRYVTRVERAGGKLLIQCPPALTRLFKESFGRHQWLSRGEPLPPFDVHCPLPSLPRVFGTSLETVPPPEPFLHAAQTTIDHWEARFSGVRTLQVGLAWAGNSAHKNDLNRSIDLSMLAPLGQIPGVRFVSLQKGERAARPSDLPAAMPFVDWSKDLHDFAETAGLIAHLDLVIAVDTSIAHLAGAMGKPVWTLLPFIPDWRWLLKRDDSPWYPTMRLFRQPALGDWVSVITDVAVACRAEAAKARPPRRVVDPALRISAAPSIVDVEPLLKTAMAHHQEGRLHEAETLYQEILDHQPNRDGVLYLLAALAANDNRQTLAIDLLQRAIAVQPYLAVYHSNLGTALIAAGRLDEGIACYRHALSLDPNFPELHNNLGSALYEKGLFEDAIVSCRQALALKPSAEAFNNLGSALHATGRIAEAIESYRRALSLNPNLAEAHTNLGSALNDIGQTDDAIASCRQALALNPRDVKAHYNLGVAQNSQGDLDAAIAAFQSCLALKPDHLAALNNLGNAYMAKAKLEDAVASFRRAQEIEPTFAESFNNLGIALDRLNRPDEAIASFHQGLKLRPKFPEALSNLGNTLLGQGKADDAIACFRQALALDPQNAVAHNSLGAALNSDGQTGEAIEHYRRAVTMKTDFADAHFNLALAALTRGDFAEGWAEYEWRWKVKGFPSARRRRDEPRWDGQPLAGRTILLHAEQGFGDTLQFVRYVPLVAAMGGKIVIECQPEIARLLQATFPQHTIIPRGQPLPVIDVQCPLLSLPLAFGTTLDSVPKPIPFVLDPAAAAQWRERMNGNAFKIGIAWAGSKDHKNDRQRSIALAALAPLAAVPGVSLYSLQKGEQSVQALTPPAGMQLTDWTYEWYDFADTAAFIANLDLVIAVDTAIIHLAATLGKPVWMLVPFAPDWRWLTERTDNPWYPSLRLFRQKALGDWSSVIGDVVAALHENRQSTTPSAPVDVERLLNTAMDHHKSGRLLEAEKIYREILLQQPNRDGVLYLLAAIAANDSRHDVAIDLLRRAIAVQPKAAVYHSNLGTSLIALDRLDEGIAAYQQALTLDPNFAEVHNNLGSAYFDRDQFAEAIASCRRALQLKPDFAEALNNLGSALQGLKQHDEAIACFRRAIALSPNFVDPYTNLGSALNDIGSLDDALAHCRHALALNPRNEKANYNLGVVLNSCGQLDDAIAAFRNTLDINPTSVDAHLSRAMLLLTRGDFAAGWPEYEWRLQGKDPSWRQASSLPIPPHHSPVQHRHFPEPRWDAQPLAGRTILLHAEQGFGDTIQFVRYIPLVAALGGKIVLECQADLQRLLQATFPMYTVIARGQPLPPFDVHCPLLSLPLAVGTSLETIPQPTPFAADANAAAGWRARMKSGTLKVGLAWAGNKTHKNDRNRSIPLAALAPFARIPGISFYSLQKGARPAAPAGMELIDWSNEWRDFADTAAFAANLDLVISVDTSVAHLAATLGKPVWLLVPFVPDWRWLLQRTDTPWYPSMHLVRQPRPSDWQSVIETIHGSLALSTAN